MAPDGSKFNLRAYISLGEQLLFSGLSTLFQLFLALQYMASCVLPVLCILEHLHFCLHEYSMCIYPLCI